MISPLAERLGKQLRNQPMQDVSDGTIEDLANIFKLLSDETRLRILFKLLRTKELHVRALCQALGQSQPAVSHHLALLRRAGLVQRRREGKHNFYRLEADRFEKLLEVFLSTMGNGNPSSGSGGQEAKEKG